MIEKIGEEKYQDLTNTIFKLMADIRLPVKRGTFIEFRKGMINCSPIGRACSQEERDAFEQYDKEAKVRPAMVEALKVECDSDKCQLRHRAQPRVHHFFYSTGGVS